MPDSARLDVAAGEACPSQWQAWTWQHSSGPRRLFAQKLDASAPGADEVVVRNAMIGLNPLDWAALTQAGGQFLEALADGTLQREAWVVGDFAHLPAHLDALRHRSSSGKPLAAVA